MSDEIDDLGAICNQCAEKYGCQWPYGHVATMWSGTCPYCKKEKGLVSTGDWDWPDNIRRGIRD